MRKFTLLILFILFFKNIYSQQSLQVSGNNIYIQNISGEKNYNIIGSKYLDENFKKAYIDNGEKPFLLRFNALNNSFEYKMDEKNIVTLDKIYDKINISNEVIIEKIKFKNLDGYENSQYLISIDNKNNNIYKFIRVKYNPPVESISSYESAKPASYSFLNPIYIMKYSGNFHELPRRSKDLIKIFPDKENEIKEFIKKNKLKFRNEEDYIKLAEFLNN